MKGDLFVKFLFTILLSVGLLGCSSDGSSSSPSLGPAASTFGKASSAISGAGQSLPGAVSLTGAKSGTIETLASVCEGGVTDLSSDASGAGEFLGCLLTANSKNPETPLGSFHLVNQIMAMLEGNISFTYASTYTNHENITGSVDTSDGVQSVTLSLRERSLSSNWSYHIQLCILNLDGTPLNTSLADCTSGSFNFEVYLVDDGTKLGFKTIERFGSFSGGAAFLIDNSTNELRFEGWDEANGRHSRVYVAGAVSTDFSLTGVTGIEVAIADQGIENSGDGTDALYAEFDGTNLCINAIDDNDNDHTNGFGNSNTDLQAQGTCASYPDYNAGFFTASGLEAFLSDETKGILDFTAASFGISNYFINN